MHERMNLDPWGRVTRWGLTDRRSVQLGELGPKEMATAENQAT